MKDKANGVKYNNPGPAMFQILPFRFGYEALQSSHMMRFLDVSGSYCVLALNV